MDFETKIESLFKYFNQRFFDNKLNQVKLEFSEKMKSSAGIFYPKQKSQEFSKIRLNRQLLKLRDDKEITETLLHEMTHAFLCLEGKVVKPHGKEFQQKVREINEDLSINIKTTHRYLTWWRCDGKCRELESSLFGFISRVCNDKLDLNQIHKNHRISCGGKYQEVEEPSNDRLKVIMKHFRLMKSRQPVKKKIIKITAQKKVAAQSKKTFFTFYQNSAKTIEYVTSDEEA